MPYTMLMEPLTPAERRTLKARAHHLHPLVLVGEAGLTPAVLCEIEVHLKSHELIKIRVAGDDRRARASMIGAICESLDASPVQHIGKILVIFRPKPAVVDEKSAPRKPRARKSSRRTKRSYQGR
jgi:RNA-binding protein